jgi:hypothetical protein
MSWIQSSHTARYSVFLTPLLFVDCNLILHAMFGTRIHHWREGSYQYFPEDWINERGQKTADVWGNHYRRSTCTWIHRWLLYDAIWTTEVMKQQMKYGERFMSNEQVGYEKRRVSVLYLSESDPSSLIFPVPTRSLILLCILRSGNLFCVVRKLQKGKKMLICSECNQVMGHRWRCSWVRGCDHVLACHFTFEDRRCDDWWGK